jgi:O-antigen ligase
VVVPGLVDFARLPQQVVIQVGAVVLVVLWLRDDSGLTLGTTAMRRLDIPLGVFLALSALSLALGPDRPAGLGTLAHWTSCIAVYGVVSRVVRRPSEVRLLLAGAFGGAVGVALVGLLQGLLQLDLVPSAAGPAGTLANRNAAAGYLVAVLPLGLWLWTVRNRAARVGVLFGSAAVLAFLPLTLARVAAVALAVQLLILWRLRTRQSRISTPGRLAAFRGAAPWLVAAGTVGLLGSAIGLTMVSPEKGRSLSIRGSLARSALAMAAEKPVLGIGLGGFADEYPRFGAPIHASATQPALRVESAHNEPLHVLAETGVPGFLALLWIAGAVLSILRRGLRSSDPERRSLALALTLSLAGFAVDGLVGFPLRTAVGPLGVAVVLGLVASLADPAGRRRVPQPSSYPRRSALATAASAAIVFSLLPAIAWAIRFQESPLPSETNALESEACPSTVDIKVRTGDRLDLVVEDAPLAEVLGCLADRTEIRLEIDGSPPAQRVSATFRDEAPATVVTELLAGLGVDYLMGFDPSGARLERVILVEKSSPAAAGPRAPTRPGAGRRPVAPGRTSGSPDESQAEDAYSEEPDLMEPGFVFGREGTPSDRYRAPGREEGMDDFDSPSELSPMTLRRPWVPGKTALGRAFARLSLRGNQRVGSGNRNPRGT